MLIDIHAVIIFAALNNFNYLYDISVQILLL